MRCVSVSAAAITIEVVLEIKMESNSINNIILKAALRLFYSLLMSVCCISHLFSKFDTTTKLSLQMAAEPCWFPPQPNKEFF